MLVHMVLYEPRSDLSLEERRRFQSALGTAIREIPSIRRWEFGRRVRHGASYEAMMPQDFTFFARMEFEDLEGLKTYLDHPAHAELGSLFYSCSTAALAYDFEITDTLWS